MTPHDRAALALYPSAALALAFLDHRVRRFPQHVVTDYVPSVLQGTSGAPAKYRVLMPYALDRLTTSSGGDAYLVFLVVEFLAILGALLMLHVYLRHWFPALASLGGTLAIAALLPLTFTNSWAHPDTFPDLMLFTAGCLFVATRRDFWLAAVLAIGMLNRETMGFLLILWCIDRYPERGRSVLTRGAGLAFIVAGVYLALRWGRGFEHYRMYMLPENLAVLKLLPEGFDPYTRIAGYFWLALLGPPAWLALRGARSAPAHRFFRSTLLVAGLFVAVAWLFAAIIETRVLVPLVPLLAPAAVAAFVSPRLDDRVPVPRERVLG